MKVSNFVSMAKKSQEKLKELGWPAEHIYLLGYSDPKAIPSLVFISSKYDMLTYMTSKIINTDTTRTIKI